MPCVVLMQKGKLPRLCSQNCNPSMWYQPAINGPCTTWGSGPRKSDPPSPGAVFSSTPFAVVMEYATEAEASAIRESSQRHRSARMNVGGPLQKAGPTQLAAAFRPRLSPHHPPHLQSI